MAVRAGGRGRAALWLALVWLTIPVVAAGATAVRLPDAVAAAVAEQGFPRQSVGVYVHDLAAEQPLVAENAERAFNPASTMKLVTTYAALRLLSADYRWHTYAYADHAPRDGVLSGDLYLRGEGDPSLVTENFWLFLRGLRARGVRHIKGDLVVDSSYFDLPPGDPGAFDGSPYSAYNVLPEALLVNYKVTRFVFIPERRPRRLRIIADPPSDTLTVENAVRLVKGSCKGGPAQLAESVTLRADGTLVRFGGSYPDGCGERGWSRAVSASQPYVYGVFKALWRELGGTLDGGVRGGVTPPGARLLHSVESRALGELIRGMNKYSNNVMARHLLLTMGAAAKGPPATVDKGIAALREWLSGAGIGMPMLVLENGAGLARDATVTPSGLGRLLLHAWHSPVMPEFMASLPVAAQEGTMHGRFRDGPMAGRAHLKTGSLNDVATLAGYLLTRSNRRLALVIMINHAGANGRRAVRAQDAILSWLFAR